MTYSIDGPTGWLDGRLQAYHKSFDGFRGAIVFMATLSCWDQTLVTACSDGIIRCLDLVSGSCCTEIDVEAFGHAEHPMHPLQRASILQAHSCILTGAGSGLLWLQDNYLCQVHFESGHAGTMKLPGSAVRLAGLPDGTSCHCGV